MTEPPDTEILEFLLNQFKAHSLKMNGESEWVFINSGFPMNRAKGKSALDLWAGMNLEQIKEETEAYLRGMEDYEEEP